MKEAEDFSEEEYIQHVVSYLTSRGVDESLISKERIKRGYDEGISPSIVIAIEHEKIKLRKANTN